MATFGMQNFSSDASRRLLQHDYQPTPSSVQRSNFMNNLTNPKDGLGINIERPKFPQYAIQTTRLQSFKNWPSYLNQTPELLAEAGFVYGGVADSVRCFFCGGGLRNWDPEDNPWEEHARWYPKCGHVRLCKGDDFIQRINEEDDDEDNLYPDVAVAQSATRVPQASASDVMKSVPVLSVLEFEKDVSKVKKAIETVISQGKTSFVAKDLMEVLLDMEEEMDTSSAPSLTENSESLSTPCSIQESFQEQTAAVEQCRIAEPESEHRQTTINETVTAEADELLLEENRRLQEQHLCKICLDERACIVFLPCGHMVSCPQFAPAMRKCPICRSVVKGTVKAYMA